MTLNRLQISNLQAYRDKCYISSVLCSESSSWFNFLKTVINLPIIILSSIMTVLNSSFNPDDIRIPNIVLNASTSLILSLLNNFKLSEKSSNMKTQSLKYTKLLHFIEDRLSNELEEIDKECIQRIVLDYDNISEGVEYEFPPFIKKRVYNRYHTKKILPNTLNCTIDFTEKIEQIERTRSKSIFTEHINILKTNSANTSQEVPDEHIISDIITIN